MITIGAAAVIVLTGCTAGDRPAPAPRPDGSTSASAASPRLGPEQRQRADAALAAYREYWVFLDAALKDPQAAAAATTTADDHASGQELQTVRSYLRQLSAGDQRVTGEIVTSPRVLAVHGRTVILTDCIDTSRTDVVAGDGTSVKDPTADARYVSEAVLTEVTGGGWRVSWTQDRRSESC